MLKPAIPLGLFLCAASLTLPAAGQAPEPLPGTRPLTMQGDLAAQMVAGIDRFLDRELQRSVEARAHHWKRDTTSREAYVRSVAPNRERLRKILGVVDPRIPPTKAEAEGLYLSGPVSDDPKLGYTIRWLRWPAIDGLEGEGLHLIPRGKPRACVVALPDADWTPEMATGLDAKEVADLTEGRRLDQARFPLRLVESGCEVIVPLLIDRRDTYSGHPEVRMTNQPHREFLYRAGFEMGRHLIGMEVQKALAALDYLAHRSPGAPLGVAGTGEGGLLALYTAAVDERPAAALVSAYFGPREQVWREPIYRNVWGLLEEFGDAEIASLAAPRALVVEAARQPAVTGPPPARNGRSGAAPGAITTPALADVRREVERARAFTRGLAPAPTLRLVGEGGEAPVASEALSGFLEALGITGRVAKAGMRPRDERKGHDPEARFRRQFSQMVEYTQRLMREGEFRRAALWSKAKGATPQEWAADSRSYRDYFWEEVIGKFPPPDAGSGQPGNPRTRLVYDEPTYRGYEVVLDLWPDVYSYGILLVPKDVKPGERRPVVVCQHGLEGRPQDVADPKVDSPYYHRYACRLAERGFVTFSPQNPYIGQDRFRVLQRKANPLKKSLFAVIVRQHERILQWLAAQPFVDPQRIGFYGLSYGGKTAMRVPALLEGYCLSICSADYNEWIWKNVSTRHRYSYMFTGEYEMYEWDLGNTFNYAEMSWLIAPRPFMVERGHEDGVAPDEWVAYEFARTRRLYDRLGIGDRTELEVFNGPHTIHGVGTFEFLHRHLRWPKPKGPAQ